MGFSKGLANSSPTEVSHLQLSIHSRLERWKFNKNSSLEWSIELLRRSYKMGLSPSLSGQYQIWSARPPRLSWLQSHLQVPVTSGTQLHGASRWASRLAPSENRGILEDLSLAFDCVNGIKSFWAAFRYALALLPELLLKGSACSGGKLNKSSWKYQYK